MTQVHDIFVRAYVVPSDQQENQQRKTNATSDPPKWPEYVMAFDTETRITADQSLTFGVFRVGQLRNDEYYVIREGLFYADELSRKDIRTLEAYVQSAISDVKTFPPEFPLYSRSDFMRKAFWPLIKHYGALVCGLNLPFDISRLALSWNRGEHDEWSLVMSQYPDGTENRNHPRILITPIDSKKAFIRLAKPWKPEEWKHGGKARFLDLRTLGWALFNRSFSLKRLCEELKTEHRKFDHEPTGEVTFKEIEYARQDGRCTVDALNGLKREFDKHPIALKPWNAFSPASIAKSYLDAMGIINPAQKFKISNENRVFRCKAIMVDALKPASVAPRFQWCHWTLPANIQPLRSLGIFRCLTAERVSFEEDTENICHLLKRISLKGCFNPASGRTSTSLPWYSPTMTFFLSARFTMASRRTSATTISPLTRHYGLLAVTL